MFFDAATPLRREDPTRLSLEELIAVQPRHFRGRLGVGHRNPQGERPGRGRASTLDFDGLGPYVPGDDVRTIDWRASMRCGETTVRHFAAASHRAHMLVVDLRPDLYFATEQRLMAKTACLSAAWLAWKAQILNEPVGLMVGGVTMAPRRGRRHVLRLLDVLLQAFIREGDTGAAADACETAAMMVASRDEVCLISDLPADTGPLEQIGRALHRTRRPRLMLVEDPFVREAPLVGRYPVARRDGHREVIRVSKTSKADSGARSRLRDSGWIVDLARDLLPWQAAP